MRTEADRGGLAGGAQAQAGLTADSLLRLTWRRYGFQLPRAMVTSQSTWRRRRGWLLRLESDDGRLGWGEAATVSAQEGSRLVTGPAQSSGFPSRGATGQSTAPDEDALQAAVSSLPASLGRPELEASLPDLPAPLACALGMALAELDGLGSASQGGWLKAPPSALLLPAGEAAISALELALTQRAEERARVPIQSTTDGDGTPAAAGRAERNGLAGGGLNPPAWQNLHLQPGITAQDDRPADPPSDPGGREAGSWVRFTVKWKVASGDDRLEQRVLTTLLERLPPDSRLRLDANGGWDRTTAWRWARRLAGEPRLDWLEQPLAADDRDGHEALAQALPVALDESLRRGPQPLAGGWSGWQVRRPLVEGDPRPLLAALRSGTPRLMLSTALETGIGRRFLEHLAALQAQGPTPTAPGLAPGWRPCGDLFRGEPARVWEAAG